MKPIVAVFDDDKSVRESLPDLLGEIGFTAKGSASAQEFLAYDRLSDAKCLILDIAMPGMSGPELQQELSHRTHRIPIVFITAHGDEALRPGALERGAAPCLLKPFSETALLEALNAALSDP